MFQNLAHPPLLPRQIISLLPINLCNHLFQNLIEVISLNLFQIPNHQVWKSKIKNNKILILN